MAKIEQVSVKIGGSEFAKSITAEYLSGDVAQSVKPIAAAIGEAREQLNQAVLKGARSIASVLAAMEAQGIGMTQKELAKALNVDQSWISRTGSWKLHASKDDAHVVTGADLGHTGNAAKTEYPVSNWESFIRLLDAGATRQIMDQHFKKERNSNGGGAPKTPQEQVQGAMVRALKAVKDSGTHVPETSKEALKAVTESLLNGTISETGELPEPDHSVQAQAATDPRDKADALVEVMGSVLATLGTDNGKRPGFWKKGQLEALQAAAGDMLDAIGDTLAEV